MEPPSAKSNTASRSAWPKWVRFALWGLPSRRWAVGCAVLSVGIAVAAVVLAVRLNDSRFWWGLLVVVAAPAYLRAAAWVDANGTWG